MTSDKYPENRIEREGRTHCTVSWHYPPFSIPPEFGAQDCEASGDVTVPGRPVTRDHHGRHHGPGPPESQQEGHSPAYWYVMKLTCNGLP